MGVARTLAAAALTASTLITALPSPVAAAIETDPAALYATMKQAYDEGTAHGWNFNDELYYQSAVFATGRAYSLFRPTDPNYARIAGLTVDIASALHYDPLSNNDASPWWVREASAYEVAHDPNRAAAATVLLARLDDAETSVQEAARIADADATANVVSYHSAPWARIAQVTVDLRALAITHDATYGTLAMQRAAQPNFPLVNLADVQSGELYDLAHAAQANEDGDAAARAAATELLRRRDATPQLQEIGHVTAIPHQFHLSITAPADEYFGPRAMSVLGMHNEIAGIEAHLKVGWGARMTAEGVDLAKALDQLHRIYPRDYELPRLLLAAAKVIDEIPSDDAKASARSLRRILVVEYPDSAPARSLVAAQS